jgi:hypothetical protein
MVTGVASPVRPHSRLGASRTVGRPARVQDEPLSGDRLTPDEVTVVDQGSAGADAPDRTYDG